MCPYDENAMTLMDYRTDYLSRPDDVVRQPSSLMDRKAGREEGRREGGLVLEQSSCMGVCVCWLALWLQEVANREPTFMYAMPMGGQPGKKRVFFEETSLVARPPMTFDECKRRMELRLKHLGVKVYHTATTYHHPSPQPASWPFSCSSRRCRVAGACRGGGGVLLHPHGRLSAPGQPARRGLRRGHGPRAPLHRVPHLQGARRFGALRRRHRTGGEVIGQAAQSVAGRRREVLVMVM